MHSCICVVALKNDPGAPRFSPPFFLLAMALSMNVIWAYYIYIWCHCHVANSISHSYQLEVSIQTAIIKHNTYFYYKKTWKALQVMLTTEYILLINQSNYKNP